MQGIVFDIQRFCTEDGPGVRTTVFLKGCNLRCAWCHNPESLRPAPQLRYVAEKCLNCGACVGGCPAGAHCIGPQGHQVNLSLCTACGACVALCPAHALERVGRSMEAEEVLRQVMRDEAYYRASGGGMTLSGGEPLMQPAFAQELLQGAKKQGLHTAMETNGLLLPQAPAALIEATDLFLLDYKFFDDTLHQRYTGQSGAPLHIAMARLAQAEKPVVLRMPVLPGLNDDPQHFARARAERKRYRNIQKIEVMPYHTAGVTKWAQTGLAYALPNVPAATEEQRKKWQAMADE